MATGYSPNDIQYTSDSNIQLQSVSRIRSYQASYQDSDPHGLFQNGNYDNGSGSSSTAHCPGPSSTAHYPGPSSSDFVVVVSEEEASPGTDPPKDYLRFSFCVMVLCCFPIGLTALQSSRECQRAISLRNMTIADAKSQEAKGRACLGVITGITTWIVVAAFIVLGVLS